ncbi:MAG: hypothetical protein ABI887_17455 [Burkholderiales bacterium]
MKPSKPIKPSTDEADNWIWRSSQGAPAGEWIDRSAPPPAPARPATAPITKLPEVSTGGWLVSSFDLLSGADVVEDDIDSVPMDLFDELFPPKAGTGEQPK